MAYVRDGLTDGGVNANKIKLTSLGRKLVAPENEGDDLGRTARGYHEASHIKEIL